MVVEYSSSTDGQGLELRAIIGYEEVVYIANGGSSYPVQVVVASLTTSAGLASLGASGVSGATVACVHWGYVDVGTLLDIPASSLAGVPSIVTLANAPTAPAGIASSAVLEDANGNGVSVHATPSAQTPGEVTLTAGEAAATASPPLTPPLRLLWDLFTVTRGASVRGEVLGTGDASLSGQDFTLARSPVTYLADGTDDTWRPGGASRSGDRYSSTITLTVDGILWTEVPTLFGRGQAERVFATYEDDQSMTHVVTGDGVNGARPATGAVVTADYRIGSGATCPPAGALTQILTPVPNLTAVRDPVAAGAGADADASDHVRSFAPRSVLTLDRAISLDDYAAVAAQASGVTRAAASWAWDPDEQHAVVRVLVGDDDAARASAQRALDGQSDANRPVTVELGKPLTVALSLTAVYDPAYVPADVQARVAAALLDAPGGLFAPGVLQIGEALFRSRLEAACAAPGLVAVRDVALVDKSNGGLPLFNWDSATTAYRPGERCWFDLAAERLMVTMEVAAHV